jgi:hypothetical protein
MQGKILSGSIAFIIIGAAVAYVLIQYTDIFFPEPAASPAVEERADEVTTSTSRQSSAAESRNRDQPQTSQGNQQSSSQADEVQRAGDGAAEDGETQQSGQASPTQASVPDEYPALSDFPSQLGSYTYERERSRVDETTQNDGPLYVYQLRYTNESQSIIVTAYTGEATSGSPDHERVETRYGYIDKMVNPNPMVAFRWRPQNADFATIDIAGLQQTDSQFSENNVPLIDQATLRQSAPFEWFLKNYKP